MEGTVTNVNLEDLCSRFSAIYTGTISDVLDEMGYPNHCLPPEIKGLQLDQKIIGVALRVEGEPTSSTDAEVVFVPILQMLGDLRPFDVIVSQPHDKICAHIGELSCEAAKYRGARGAVIDGGARDIGYILKLGFPVFCRYFTSLDVIGRWKLTSYGQPIQIGSVTIRRGDFIVGDQDGVLAIPQELALEVLCKAEEVFNTENFVRKAILKGVHPVDAFRQYGRF